MGNSDSNEAGIIWGGWTGTYGTEINKCAFKGCNNALTIAIWNYIVKPQSNHCAFENLDCYSLKPFNIFQFNTETPT